MNYSGIAIDGFMKGRFFTCSVENIILPELKYHDTRFGELIVTKINYRHFIDVSGNHYWTCEPPETPAGGA